MRSTADSVCHPESTAAAGADDGNDYDDAPADIADVDTAGQEQHDGEGKGEKAPEDKEDDREDEEVSGAN